MGSVGKGVEPRPNSIRLRFTWEGKPRYPTLMTNGAPMAPTPANLRYAARLAAEIREKIKLGTFSYYEYFPESADASSGAELTLSRQMRAWIDAQRIEQSTRAGYLSAIRFWEKAEVDGVAMGDRPLRGVKHSDLLRALGTKAALSGKTVNNYVSVVREALEMAVTDGVLPVNPAGKVPRASHQKEPADPFTLTEAEAIIADICARYPEPVGNFVEWWFFSGCRPSEAVGLRWGSVDFASGYMQISEAIVRGQEKDSTKTNVSRSVRLNSRSLAALQRQKAHTFLAGDFVWLDPRYGAPWTDERAFRRSFWAPTLKRLGIRYRSQRHMRHTYATMLLMAGRTAGWCASQLGHSIEMFHRTYSRWIVGVQDAQETQGLEDWLTRGKPDDKKGESL